MKDTIEMENQYGTHHYKPLPVVLTKGDGIHVWDDQDNRYIDMMSAYSAVSHGHCHPRLIKALTEQAKKLNVVSRAYYTEGLAPFLKRACELTGYDKALPMNTGAEAVETAIKAARKWAYEKKGVAENKAEIIVCEGNFHGRTTTILSFSSEALYKKDFGPLTPGFKIIPYDDIDALKKAINENTAAFLIEPIQGEGGIIIPQEGYLKACKDLCEKENVLMIADEIQTGLGRTGELLACSHDNVKPDGLILGKALGGGVLPVSLFLGMDELMSVFTPGTHGSTFGGNQLASIVALEALNVLVDEKLSENSKELGEYFLKELQAIDSELLVNVRGRGLFIGLEINPKITTAREVCLKLLEAGILSKETHDTVVRFAPPLIITKSEIDEALAIIKEVLHSF